MDADLQTVKKSRKQCISGFFVYGIKNLMDQSNRCMEKLEDYVKK
jgi:hypothetical protein